MNGADFIDFAAKIAATYSDAASCRSAVSRAYYGALIGMKLILISPGEFDMGSSAGEIARLLEEGKRQTFAAWHSERVPAEAPQHRVKISKSFYLGVCEVTQAEYGRVMGQDPSNFKGDPNRPVEQVNWSDAVEFCQRLSASPKEKATGAVYRLPTEAEWEFACRAGAMTRYSFGDAATGLGQNAWWKENSQGQTQPVGRLRPNAWGLFDMYGNVWEWCDDWYGPYQAGTVSDHRGPGTGLERVLRGGGWLDFGWDCRSAYRLGSLPGHRLHGFRVVRTLALWTLATCHPHWRGIHSATATQARTWQKKP